MLYQSALPLEPSMASVPSLAAALGGSSTSAAGVDSIRYRPSRVRTPYRRSDSISFGRERAHPVLALDPYRGSADPFLEDVEGRRRRRTIVVRTGLPQALLQELRRQDSPATARAESIEIGAACDPYPAAEARLGLTRSVLEVLCQARGLVLALTTRSPLVLRDHDLLRQLDLRHSVTVTVPMTTLDARSAAGIEPGTATPGARLEVVRRLAADGITTRVRCTPVLPGINSSADELDPLFAAARQAGAVDVTGDARALWCANRRRLVAWLKRNFPDRLEVISSALGHGDPQAALGTLQRLRLAYGFPVLRAGRG